MTGLHSIAQTRAAAKRRLPNFAFDFLDGGAGAECAIRENMAAFERLSLVPRALRGVVIPDCSTTLFGRRYAAPFGIAPMGLPAIAWPGADLGLARAAAAADLPFSMSTAAGIAIAQAAAAAPGATWLQLYPGQDKAWNARRLEEAEAAGIDVLLLTVDRPVMGWRVRDLTNGVGLQMKLNARAIIDMVAHPRWSIATAQAGKPAPAYPPPAGVGSAVPLDWAFVAALRKRWTGTLVVKGVLHPDDARLAINHGADGVVVSNHGGAHLDSAPAAVAQLPAIRDAVGRDAPVLLDGGVRSGEDIVKALALGADFVLLGRAFAYAVAALGPDRGPAWVIDLLRQQLLRTLQLIGCPAVAALEPAYVSARSA